MPLLSHSVSIASSQEQMEAHYAWGAILEVYQDSTHGKGLMQPPGLSRHLPNELPQPKILFLWQGSKGDDV